MTVLVVLLNQEPVVPQGWTQCSWFVEQREQSARLTMASLVKVEQVDVAAVRLQAIDQAYDFLIDVDLWMHRSPSSMTDDQIREKLGLIKESLMSHLAD